MQLSAFMCIGNKKQAQYLGRSAFAFTLKDLCDLFREIIWSYIRPCLVPHPKFFHPSHQIFGHMHGTLNVDKKIN